MSTCFMGETDIISRKQSSKDWPKHSIRLASWMHESMAFPARKVRSKDEPANWLNRLRFGKFTQRGQSIAGRRRQYRTHFREPGTEGSCGDRSSRRGVLWRFCSPTGGTQPVRTDPGLAT